MGKIYDALEKFNREKLRRPDPKDLPHLREEEQDQVLTPIEIQELSPNSAYPGAGLDERLIILSDPMSLATEQFKILRSRILYPREGAAPRTIMVTSAMLEEGKSLVAANLAVSMAQGIQQHVLLVDCDMRRPIQHVFFKVPGERGLSDHLSYNAPLARLLVKTAVDMLTLLPGGMPPANPSELLSSEKMLSFIKEVKERYTDRVILFDATPVQITAEVSVLAKHVDGIVMVIRRGKSDRETVERAIPVLGRDKLIGVVFNCFGCFSREYQQYKSYKYFED